MAQELRQRILNVDDTEAARYAKTRILSRAGYDVIEAATGLAAIERVRAEMPDLVLLDTKLPDINGFEVCRRLKEDPVTCTVLILQTSASYVAVPDKIRGLNSGADNYLFEPIESDELLANVRALLRLARVERELRDVDRRKDEFLAVLAHELRNPLGPIRSAADFLGHFSAQYSPAQENARKMILRQTTHMVRLIDDLLDVSRISQGKIALKHGKVLLKDVLDAAVETAMSNIRQREHTFERNEPDEPIWLCADCVRLSQVVSNLLNNAAKFTSPRGHITLSAVADADQVFIRVQDNGIGIAEQHLGSIFGLFEQAGHSADRVQDGLGIGLSLVQRLVRLHGGEVRALSAGAGHGSTFEVMLYTLPPGPSCKVLVVDLNSNSRETLAARLASQGHLVESAADGSAAMAAIGANRPQIVFIDTAIADGTRLDLVRHIRSASGLPKIVLAGVAADMNAARAQALRGQFDHILASPPSLDQIRQAIATVQCP